jgi:hypothetical protein
MKTIFIFCSILLSFNGLFAQSTDSSFFNFTPDVRSTLESRQLSKLSVLERNPKNKSVYLTRIKNLITHQQDSYFDFNLPGKTEIFRAKATSVEKDF